ncbi:hypothetical protein GY45DRAFT_1321172 [Cubamyces sp. BRFM 1775]|nr:hypothetical protein GY45DRAFT_1321172 [Cubamyces sp. BRFM 1775]
MLWKARFTPRGAQSHSRLIYLLRFLSFPFLRFALSFASCAVSLTWYHTLVTLL